MVGLGAHHQRGLHNENYEEKASDKVLGDIQNVAQATTYDEDEKSR